MRLASFNLLHGRSLTDGLVVPARLREAAQVIDADVVGLQEVDRGQPRSGGRDLTADVAAAMDAAHWRFAPALVGTPGEPWRAAGDDAVDPSYGCGIVSRHPVLEWHTVRLAAARVRSPVLLPGTRRLVWLRDEPRVGIAAVLDSPLGPLTVATTHLSFVPGWNTVQLRRLCHALERLPGPHVLLGDLNMPPPLPRLTTGWRSLASVRTYPAAGPRVQLDHALARGALPPVRAVTTHALAVSDHCALVVEL